jgi:hypothetical protein
MYPAIRVDYVESPAFTIIRGRRSYFNADIASKSLDLPESKRLPIISLICLEWNLRHKATSSNRFGFATIFPRIHREAGMSQNRMTEES